MSPLQAVGHFSDQAIQAVRALCPNSEGKTVATVCQLDTGSATDATAQSYGALAAPRAATVAFSPMGITVDPKVYEALGRCVAAFNILHAYVYVATQSMITGRLETMKESYEARAAVVVLKALPFNQLANLFGDLVQELISDETVKARIRGDDGWAKRLGDAGARRNELSHAIVDPDFDPTSPAPPRPEVAWLVSFTRRWPFTKRSEVTAEMLEREATAVQKLADDFMRYFNDVNVARGLVEG